MSGSNSDYLMATEENLVVSNPHLHVERQTDVSCASDVREPSIKRDPDERVEERISEQSLLTSMENQRTDFACSKMVLTDIPSLVDSDKNKNHSDMNNESSEKDDINDFASDDDSHETLSKSSENMSNISTESVNRSSCKRKFKQMKHHRKKKKRKLKSGNIDEKGDNNQPSYSLYKNVDKKKPNTSKPVKIPFRFSPKKSCSGSRFKRKLLDSKRKKLRFKRRKVEGESDSSDDESGFGVNDELEEMLESNAVKNNLTAINVKSILHHVITNEHVLAMVRNTMLEEEKKEPSGNAQDEVEGEGMNESQEALFEPKMTRSKLKEVVQQAWNAPYVWPLSPVKGKNVVPQFAELNFPEDSEDDEDYQPDPNEKEESDHESYVSSQISDFGSPLPSTPLSRYSFLDNKEESPIIAENKSKKMTEDLEKASISTHPHVKGKVDLIKPLPSQQQSDKISDDNNFMMMLDEMDKELDSMNQNKIEMDNIAKRTRSKLTIENSLDEIEASFIAPDITADMYDSDCEDKEWKEWLKDLYKDKKDNELNDTFDDEQNDPDFNFMANEEEVIDTEETRTDRAVRVSKKELNVLLDELLESYGGETGWNEPFEVPQVDYHTQKTVAGMLSNKPANTQAVPKVPIKVVLIVTPEERLQLTQQMQQHVQLLCQMYLLGRGDKNYNMEANQAKMFLNELAMLGGITLQKESSEVDTNNQPFQSDNSFIASNLRGALEIVNNWNDEKRESPTNSTEKRGKKKQEHATCSTELYYNSKPVPNDAKIVLMSSTVFMYPELLPHCGLKYQATNKPTFVDSEDNLIVLGLQQFDKLDTKFRLIQKHMVPSKTVKQIQARIKNFSTKKKQANSIKNFKLHNVIPPSRNPCQPVLPGQAVAPIFQFQSRLPDWMKNLKMTSLMKLERDLEKERETEERTKRAVFASLDESTNNTVEISKLKQTLVPLRRRKKHGMALPKMVTGNSLPVGIIQTLNGQQIIQLLPNQILQSNSGVMPSFTNIPPHQISLANAGPIQAVVVPPNTHTKTEVTAISVPTSSTFVGINSVMNKSIIQQGNSQNTGLAQTSLQCITMSSPSVVTSPSIITLQQVPSTKAIAVNPIKTTQALSNVSSGTGILQPTTIVIPPNTQTQEKMLVQQSTVVLVQNNGNNQNSSGSETPTSKETPPIKEVNQEVSSSFQKALVPSTSQMIQLSPGKHGPVIQFGGRKSLTKDSMKVAIGKNIMPICLSKGGGDGISALRGFQILHASPDAPIVSDQPQEGKSEKTAPEKSEQSDASCLTITNSAKNSENLNSNLIAKDSKCSSSISPTEHHTKSTGQLSEITDAKGSKIDPDHGQCAAATYDSNIPVVTPDSVAMETVSKSVENTQKEETDLNISKDSRMLMDDSICQYNEKDEGDIEVDIMTTDDDDMNSRKEQKKNEKTTYEDDEDKPIDDDEDDFELDVVGVSDSTSSAVNVKDPTTKEITKSSTKPEDQVDIEDGQDNNPDEEHPMESVSNAMSEEQLKASRKVAAKRLKNRLRKEMESTVVLLDPNIVENDPKKAERDDIFARAYLNRVKDTFKTHPYKYLEFLKVLSDFHSDELHISQFYDSIKNVLAGQEELIEDFTAFLDPKQAVECGVLMSHLEFSKARLFLREVEVHFQKQSGHFQKILKAIVTWGETENRTYQQLKDLLLPLLKGQPHLEQELTGLFPDDKPAENLMPDFEMAEWSEDKKFDGFEEIVFPDSDDEEKHMKGKMSTGKLDIVDPWRRLNAELQYGTKRCRCSCHDRSLDSRVQKKARHCAYCTAKVSRAELTSSFKGITSVKSRASKNTRRKVSKAQKGSRQFANMVVNENEEDQDDRNSYSAAVSNLSEMCSNLADYLNENACMEMEEEPGDVETEEEDIEEIEIDDEEADDEVQKLIGNGLVAEDDPELITGADTASSNSPDADVSSQESKESSESDESNFASPPSKSPLSHSNSLVDLPDKVRSATNSPIRYSFEDTKTENIVTRITHIPKGREENDIDIKQICAISEVEHYPTGENTFTGTSIVNDIKGGDLDVRSSIATDPHLVSGGTEVHRDSSDNISESNVISSNPDSSFIIRHNDGDNDEVIQPSSSLEKDINQINSIREHLTGELMENIEKLDENVKICVIEVSQSESKDRLTKCLKNKDFSTSDEKKAPETRKFDKGEKSDKTILITIDPDKSEALETLNKRMIETRDSDRGKASKTSDAGTAETKDTRKTNEGEAEDLKCKMSADNIKQTSDGNVIISWTRDADRLLLQTCQKMDNNTSTFELVSQQLGNKSVSEVEDRFNTLMALFTKHPKSDGEESGDGSDSEHTSASDVDV
ncbi:GON-4-like protein [Anneissia japonica]|uniref:GON-4-like protein n=1 Tax=Anneissia japonica TaxID=1529436 RepID=UPI00142581FF|nr:GON-4-like protein [Anneissia japonica]